ncbi:MAG: PAS domain S-box protein [Nitrospinae bacterium]|nr:PAS domain S-box protein [Nitrospinota bacterium]
MSMIKSNIAMTLPVSPEDIMQSHNRQLTVLNELEAIVYIADMETYEVIFANAYLKGVLGDVIGKTCWESLQVGQAGPCDFCTNAKLTDKSGNPVGVYEWEFQNTKVGRWYHIRDKAIEWVDGRIVRLEIATDITKRKLAEEALANSEKKYRQLVENLMEGIWVTDKDGFTSFVNPSMARLLGYSPGEMIGKHIFSFMDEHAKTSAMQNMERRKQGISEQHDFEFLHKDGSPVYTAMQSSPIYDEAGNYTGSHSGVINITRRKLAEGQLKQAEENVRHLSKIEAIGSLAAGIAHEFNNTLHAVIGYATLARERSRDDDRLVHYMDNTLKACKRGQDVISSLLTFSMKGPYSPIAIDAAKLVTQSIAVLRPLLPSTIDITSDIDRDTGSILTDPTMFTQVMANIASNAEHAIGPKIGCISINLASVNVDPDYLGSMPGKIKIGKLDAGRYALLTIADTGCGIAPEVMDKIFEPFISYKPRDQGTGLGLAVVGGLVLRADGAIAIESRLGIGSAFHLYLPATQLYEAQHSTTGFEQKDVEPKHKSKCVLLVDDDALVLAVMEEILTGSGLTVVTAVNGEEALDIFYRNPARFDIAIIDQVMPKMTGTVLAHKMGEKRPDMPMILCTGYGKASDHENQDEPETSHTLKKPFGPEELMKIINGCFSG